MNLSSISADRQDPALSLAIDFGFENNFNHSLKVEEKKNQQNGIGPPQEAPPVPPLPPRKGSYTPSNPLPPMPIPTSKDRVLSIQAKDAAFITPAKTE